MMMPAVVFARPGRHGKARQFGQRHVHPEGAAAGLEAAHPAAEISGRSL
jgi:hypothetical protein